MKTARHVVVLLALATVPASARGPAAPPTTRLAVPGLARPVEVRRDRWGIPHIYAHSQRDLFFAQGFVAAQDRLFQMEMWRRLGEGRLAEVLGPSAVERDRLARLFRYRGGRAQEAKEWTAYAPDTRAIVRAFVAGVNAWIARAGDDLPPEFGLLGFRPEPWTETVPLTRITALSGVNNASTEVLRASLVAKLGPEKVAEILPTNPPRALDPAPGLDLAGLDYASLGGSDGLFADIAYQRLEGSNDWVVSGAKTATGKPILANDPHRAITNPAVRYLTHLVAPGWNVIGAGEPGQPGVAIGHNDRIAFGLTVVGMDQADVYVEKLGACGRAERTRTKRTARTARTKDENDEDSLGCYWFRGAWRPIETLVETVAVKGEAARRVRLQFTGHGPLVSIDRERRRGIAVRSVHAEPGTAAYLASLSLDRARDWPQFEAAMARWAMPSENMVYADVDGHIGWIAAGLMPRRSWSGLLPVPGDGGYEWSGFVPGRQLPRAYDPPAGFIATANNNILPPGYPIPLSYEWANRNRIDRLREVLGEDRKFTLDDFARLQHDDFSKVAQALVPRLTAAAGRLGRAARPEVALLSGWDLRMSRDQVAPTLFSAWAPALYRRAAKSAYAGLPDVGLLLAGFPRYEWLETALAAPTVGGESTDALLLAALDDAVAELEKRLGSDRAKWEWGKVHFALFPHPLSARYDLPPASRGGDGNTVNATGGRDFKQTTGASFREIIDLADFDRSLTVNVPGQSADPRSPHYGDLLPYWATDRYFPLVYSRARVEAETESVLWLDPVGKKKP
jgi:penicillin amidase